MYCIIICIPIFQTMYFYLVCISWFICMYFVLVCQSDRVLHILSMVIGQLTLFLALPVTAVSVLILLSIECQHPCLWIVKWHTSVGQQKNKSKPTTENCSICAERTHGVYYKCSAICNHSTGLVTGVSSIRLSKLGREGCPCEWLASLPWQSGRHRLRLSC